MIHRTTAILMTVCILTAAVLYNGFIAVPVGHRHLIELIHVYCGFALPVPMPIVSRSALVPSLSEVNDP